METVDLTQNKQKLVEIKKSLQEGELQLDDAWLQFELIRMDLPPEFQGETSRLAGEWSELGTQIDQLLCDLDSQEELDNETHH